MRTTKPLITRRFFSATLAAAVAIGAVPFAGAASAADAKPDAIRIGSTAPGHFKFILFRHQKLLEKEFEADGIPIELTTFDGGSAASVALGSGALDVTYIGNNPSLRLAASGANVKLVGLSSWLPSNETLVLTRADSDIQTLADLKGKRVGYLAGTVRHSTFAKALEAQGLTIDDVESLNIGIESSGPALARGDIDAIVEGQGAAQRLVEAGQARIVFDAAKDGRPEWAVPHAISVNGDFAQRYPGIVERILKVDIAAAEWVDANPEEAISIFVQETGNSEAAVRATYADGRFYQNPEITPAAVEALKGEEAFMAKAGLLQGTIDYDRWIDRSFLEAATAERTAGN